MPSSGYDNYFNFMHWFQANHLALYAKYQLHVSLSKENNMIQADLHAVAAEDHEAMNRLIAQYYQQ